MKTAFLYARTSTNKQDISVDKQKRMLASFYDYRLKEEGYQWHDIYVDPAITSRIDFHERPAGEAICERIRPGDAFVTHGVLRAFRNPGDFLARTDNWREKGVKCIFIDLGVDMDTPIGQVVGTIMAALGRWERDLCSIRTAEALQELQRQGRASNNSLAWGYEI